MKAWTKEELIQKLKEKKETSLIYQWSLKTERIDREEAYFICSEKKDAVEVDQLRTVQEDTTILRLEVDKDNKLGSATGKLHHQTNLDKQIEDLIEAAKLGEEKKWSLGAACPTQEAFFANQSDSIIWESPQAAMKSFSENMFKAIEETGIESFNSAELFLTKSKENLLLSNGFEGERASSKIYTEVCFSASRGEASEEFLLTKLAGTHTQIDFRAICRESLENAKASLHAPKRPPTGNYSVILDIENLSTVLVMGLANQLDATYKYFGLPFMEKGSELIPGFDGGAFRIWLDPHIKHAFCSRNFDEYGSPQKKTLLVENNQVMENLVNKKISSYLGIPEGSSVGSIVLEPRNTKNITELQHSQDKVLHILQLSSMEMSSESLTFSSEIRLAYLYDNKNGTKTVIKGGSISGNFKENFKKVQWSNNQQLFDNTYYDARAMSYYGPCHAMLNDVSVSS